VEQDPGAGKALKKGEKVSIVSSSGPGDVEVPKVMGMPVNAAKKKVDEAGLDGQVRWVSLAETASGVVLRQSPEPGKTVKPKTPVELIVNR
jgi:serine/threonine-protein kinase